MDKPKSLAHMIIVCVICLSFAIGSNYIVDHVTQENLIYGTKEARKIGASYMTYNNPFYTVVNNEVSKIVKQHGDTLITLDPAMSLKKQKEQIQYLINEQVDALIITPVDYKGLKDTLKKVYEAHIPVVVVDTQVQDDKYVTYSIVSDNYDAGVQCAKDMMSKLDHAKIVLVQHSKAQSGYLRIKGFLDTIKNNANYQVVKRIECQGQLEIAMPKMEKWIESCTDFDVVMCLNDPSALGVMAALSSKGILDDKYVYGIDGTPDAKRQIEEGKMTGTVAQYPRTFGKKAARMVYRIFAQKKIKPKHEVYPVKLITKENIQDYSLEEWQ